MPIFICKQNFKYSDKNQTAFTFLDLEDGKFYHYVVGETSMDIFQSHSLKDLGSYWQNNGGFLDKEAMQRFHLKLMEKMLNSQIPTSD